MHVHNCLFLVGEEDEVSIRDVAHMVAEAMEFKGELIVSYNITHCSICVHLGLFSIIRDNVIAKLSVSTLYASMLAVCCGYIVATKPFIRKVPATGWV